CNFSLAVWNSVVLWYDRVYSFFLRRNFFCFRLKQRMISYQKWQKRIQTNSTSSKGNLTLDSTGNESTFPMMASSPAHKAPPLPTAANNIHATLPIIANPS